VTELFSMDGRQPEAQECCLSLPACTDTIPTNIALFFCDLQLSIFELSAGPPTRMTEIYDGKSTFGCVFIIS
jgi:hypothetical protein